MNSPRKPAPARKYPRTHHLPDSPGATSDDRILTDLAGLTSELVVTEKMDGGNLTFTRDLMYARSVDSGTHVWDRPAKALWARVAHEIPYGWRVCGESMWARRSVAYPDLPGVFLVFGVWDAAHTLRGWDETADHSEGFVVRAAAPIPEAEFGRRVAKWVRPQHVRTEAAWRHRDDFAVNGFTGPAKG
jgi:hypothetical protein